MLGWLAHCHGARYDEPGYVHVPRCILAERMIVNRDGTPPLERRLFVFDGRVQMTQTVVQKAQSDAFWPTTTAAGTDCRGVAEPSPHPNPVPPPKRYDAILDVAERLGSQFDHVRVDLYDADEQIYAGEMTLYSWSGLMHFKTVGNGPCARLSLEAQESHRACVCGCLVAGAEDPTDGDLPSAYEP